MRRAGAWGVAVGAVLWVMAGICAAAPSFVGVNKCKPCHMPEFGTWSESAHAAATENVKASSDFQEQCLTCHATTQDGQLPGVQCEACHGPGSDYWPVAVMVKKEAAIRAGLVMPGPDMCGHCHDGEDHHTAVEFGAFRHDHREKKTAKELD